MNYQQQNPIVSLASQNTSEREHAKPEENKQLKGMFQSFAVFYMKPNRPLKKIPQAKGIQKPNHDNMLTPEILQKILKRQKEQKSEGVLVMDQIGMAGIPSLWMSNQELVKQGYLIKDTVKLLEKYHKMFSVLRCHKKWENEKMFGKNSHALLQAGQAPVEFQYFRNNKLVSKFNENEQTLNQNEQEAQQLPLTRQYVRSFFPLGSQGTSQQNYLDSENATYKMVNSDKLIIKQVLETNNVYPAAIDSQIWQLLWSCNALIHKQQIYESLTDYQKVNHFINSTELTRKDKLYQNYAKMRDKFGNQEFNFLPETYVLPDQMAEFKIAFNENQQSIKYHSDDNSDSKYQDNVWIVKPSCSSRGRGIYILTDLKDIPKEEGGFVVSKYLSNPLLINSHKFDLRVYVLITSVDPLKVYVFNEGLVRFASEPYNHDFIKGGKFSHLTNYSINKKSENFVQNKTAQERDVGNKWSMSALQHHLQLLGINFKPIWERIYDMIIKSLISVESQMMCNTKKQNPNSSKPSNCFELLGYDILLDSDLKAWILEVNLAPSLTADSPLDFHIKSNLIVDIFNLAGIRRPLKRNGKLNQRQGKQKSNSVAHNTQLPTHAQTQYNGFVQDQQQIHKSSSKEHMNSQTNLMKATPNQVVVGRNNMRKGNGTLSQGLGPGNASNNFISYFDYGMSMGNARKTLIGGVQPVQPTYDGIEIAILERISKVSAKHRALLYETLWEFERNTRLNFTRIFPSPGCSHYDQFFDAIRPNNKLIYKYLCQKTELWAIIEQSCFNDLKQELIADQQKEMTVIDRFETPQKNQQALITEDKQEQLPTEGEVSEVSPPQSASLVKEQIKEDRAEKSFMERRKSMSRKQTSRTFKDQNDFKEEALPMLNVQTIKQALSIDNRSQADDSVYENSLIYEQDETLQQKSINLATLSNTIEPVTKTKAQLTESQSKKVIKVQHQTNLTTGFHSSVQSSKEKNKDSIYSSVVSQQRDPTPGKDTVLTSQKIKQNQTSLVKTKNSQRDVQVKPIIKDGKLVYDHQAAEPFSAPMKLEQDLPNISSPKMGIIKPIAIPISNCTKLTTKSPLREIIKRGSTSINLQEVKTKSASQVRLKISDSTQKEEVVSQDRNPEQKTDSSKAESKTDSKSESKPQAKKKKEKVVITGDDILIEYVRRIKNALKKYPVKDQPSNVIYYMEKFLFHKVWSLNDQNVSNDVMKNFKSSDLRKKLKIRYVEMKSRRESVKALDKTIEQKALFNKETMQQYIDRINRIRNDIVSALTSTQVEQMVIQSNQQNPIEIVSYLVGKKAENGGLLTRIERYGQKAAANTEKQKEDEAEKRKRSETQMTQQTRLHQFVSPPHLRQTQENSLESSIQNLAGKSPSNYAKTFVDKQKYDRKDYEGFESLGQKKQQILSHPNSMLEKHDLKNIERDMEFTNSAQETQLMQTPKSSHNKSFHIQHLQIQNTTNTKTFRKQGPVFGQAEEMVENLKSVYNTTTDIKIADEQPILNSDSYHQNRFNPQGQGVTTVNAKSRSHTYNEPTMQKRQLQQNIQQTNAQNKNISFQKNLVSGESNKSLRYLKNSQYEIHTELQQSPLHQIKNALSQNDGKQPRTLEPSKASFMLPNQIVSDQYTLKNQQLSSSNSCAKPNMAKKTTASIDRTVDQHFNEHGRNFNAKSHQDNDEDTRQRIAVIQLNPMLSASPLVLPKIETQVYQNSNSYKINITEKFDRGASQQNSINISANNIQSSGV